MICEKWIAYYINMTDCSSGFNQKNWTAAHFVWWVLPAANCHGVSQKIWPTSHFFHKNFFSGYSVMHSTSSLLLCLPIQWWGKWFELQYSVITTTQLAPNSNQESVKWQTLCQINPLEILSDRITPIQFQTVDREQRTSPHVTLLSQLLVSILLRFHAISLRRLDSILLCFHAIFSRLLLNLWYSNNPEPNVHFFVLESK